MALLCWALGVAGHFARRLVLLTRPGSTLSPRPLESLSFLRSLNTTGNLSHDSLLPRESAGLKKKNLEPPALGADRKKNVIVALSIFIIPLGLQWGRPPVTRCLN